MKIFNLFAAVTIFGWISLYGIEVYFSPADNIESKIIKYINREQRTIKAALYWFTSEPIAQAIIAAKDRGVQIELIVDQDTVTGIAGKAEDMAQESIPVSVYNGNNASIMHHKFWIFGSGVLITGSFNPTRRANKANHENIIIIEDVAVSHAYEQEFERLKKITAPYNKRKTRSGWSAMRIDKTLCDWLGI